jgi:hypothetical protein
LIAARDLPTVAVMSLTSGDVCSDLDHIAPLVTFWSRSGVLKVS